MRKLAPETEAEPEIVDTQPERPQPEALGSWVVVSATPDGGVHRIFLRSSDEPNKTLELVGAFDPVKFQPGSEFNISLDPVQGLQAERMDSDGGTSSPPMTNPVNVPPTPIGAP